jgi:hypothetical protein
MVKNKNLTLTVFIILLASMFASTITENEITGMAYKSYEDKNNYEKKGTFDSPTKTTKSEKESSQSSKPISSKESKTIPSQPTTEKQKPLFPIATEEDTEGPFIVKTDITPSIFRKPTTNPISWFINLFGGFLGGNPPVPEITNMYVNEEEMQLVVEGYNFNNQNSQPGTISMYFLMKNPGGQYVSYPFIYRTENFVTLQLESLDSFDVIIQFVNVQDRANDLYSYGNEYPFTYEEDEIEPTQQIGMNLGTVRRYATIMPFVDLFKYADGYEGGSYWQSDDDIVYDDNHYPVEVVPPDETFTWFGGKPYESYPAGTYTLIMEGSGTLELDYDASGTFDQNGGEHSYQVDVDPTNMGVKFIVTRSDINDPLTNFRFIMPGHENTYLTQPFYPLFLDKLRPFSPIRFMRWQRINQAPIETWNERTKLSHVSQVSNNGVAYEYAIWLANEVESDPWFAIPHRVDDNFVRELAQLIYDELDSERKVYLEYSNELWRGSGQRTYAIEQGLLLWPGISNNDAVRRWTAKRSIEIFEIFNEVFGSESGRIVKIVPGWSGQWHYNENLLEEFAKTEIDGIPINPNGLKPDAFAGAPYFGRNVFEDVMNEGTQDSITVDEIIQMLHDTYVGEGIQRMTIDRETIDEYNLLNGWNMELMAYEGGQHLMAVPPEDYPPLELKLTEANRHPGMYDVYETYFDAWDELEGTSFAHFQFVHAFNDAATGQPTGGGYAFGAPEYLAQPLDEAPKYAFLFDRATSSQGFLGDDSDDFLGGEEYYIEEHILEVDEIPVPQSGATGSLHIPQFSTQDETRDLRAISFETDNSFRWYHGIEVLDNEDFRLNVLGDPGELESCSCDDIETCETNPVGPWVNAKFRLTNGGHYLDSCLVQYPMSVKESRGPFDGTIDFDGPSGDSSNIYDGCSFKIPRNEDSYYMEPFIGEGYYTTAQIRYYYGTEMGRFDCPSNPQEHVNVDVDYHHYASTTFKVKYWWTPAKLIPQNTGGH